MRARYYPILTAKQGELIALKHLPEATRANLTPVLDVPPIARRLPPKPGAEARPPITPEAYVKTRLLEPVPNCWSREREIFIDLDGFERYRPGGLHPVAYLAGQLPYYPARRGLVVSNVSTAEYRQQFVAVREAFAEVALRIHVQPEASPETTRAAIYELEDELGLNPFGTDLLIDLGDIAVHDPDELAAFATEHVRAVPRLDNWRALILAATAAPPTTKVRSGQVERFDRDDWALWREVAAAVEVRLAFADYGVTGVRPQTDQPQRRPGPNIRYTADRTIVFLKGRLNGSEPDDDDVVGPSYPDLCAALMDSSEYAGSGASWGDRQMAKAKAGTIGPGGPREWVTYASNHHLAQVVRQLGDDA